MYDIFARVMQVQGAEELAIAGAVALVMLTWKMVVPGWDWETFNWREMVRFGLCLLLSMGAFVAMCYADLDIPGLTPMCGLQGGFNYAITGFLAFLVNRFGDEAAQAIIKRVRAVIKRVRSSE